MNRGLFIASAAACAVVAPLVPMPPKAVTMDSLAAELYSTLEVQYGTGLDNIEIISDEMLRLIERDLLKLPNIVRVEASRSATPGCIDVYVVEMKLPVKFDITFSALGEIAFLSS